jgi:hypothetical protein
MKNLYVKLSGKKTYLIAILIAVLNLAVGMGWISPAHLDQINLLLGAAGLGALRSSVDKVGVVK